MPFLCKNCGNKTTFRQEGTEPRFIKEWWGCTQFVDEHGCIVDESDYSDCLDSDTEEYGDFEQEGETLCQECDTPVTWVEDDEWERFGSEKQEDETWKHYLNSVSQ